MIYAELEMALDRAIPWRQKAVEDIKAEGGQAITNYG
jgi:hypothetical protein